MSYENGAIIIGGTSITIIAVVVVLFTILLMLIGLKKGFGAQLFGLLGTVAVILVSVLLSPAVNQLLRPLLGEAVRAPIANWVSGITVETEVDVIREVLNWADAGVRAEFMPAAAAAIGLPSLVSGLLSGALGDIFAGFGQTSLEVALPDLLTTWALTAIAFIVLILLCSVVLAVIKRFFRRLNRIRVFGTANRVFGMLFGLIKAYVYISIFLMLTLMIPSSFPGMSAVNDQIARSTIVSFLYENNFIAVWIIKLLPAV